MAPSPSTPPAPPQRIFVLIDRYLPILGGAQNNVHEVCRRLAARGFQVTVLTRKVEPGMRDWDVIEGVAVRRFGRAPLRLLSKLLCLLRIVAHLVRRRDEYDAVLCVACNHVCDVLPGYLASRLTGRPYAIRTTGIDNLDVLLSWRARSASGWLWRLVFPPPLWRRALEGAALVATQSQIVHEHMARYGLRRSAVIPNGVDTRRFRPATAEERRGLRRRLHLPEDRVLIVTTGRYVHGKNQMALIRVAEKLAASPGHSRLTLLVLGATERGQVTSNEEALKAYVSERGLGETVLFLDDVANVEDYLRASDVFAFASRYPEGVANSLLEAMACGLPLVCSDLPQNAGVVPRAGSFLFAPDDLEALAHQLGRLVASRPLRESHRPGLAAFARARYPSETTVRRWASVFDQIAAERA